MTPGPRVHKQASLRVVIPQGVPESMRQGMREIVGVTSENPRKGHATALMHTVCAEADHTRMVLMLEAKPFAEGMTQEQLETWYARFGFQKIQETPVLMARQAQVSRIARAA